MADRPSFAQLVSSVSESVAFYTKKIGFTLQEYKAAEDIAIVIDPDGDQLLLAGSAVQDLSSYLNEQHMIFKPGESLDFLREDLESQRTELLSKGVAENDIHLVERRTGTRILSVKGPDNYRINFIYSTSLSTAEILEVYAQGPDELDAALAGLEEADLDLTLSEGSWSIRQIVHHLADADILFGETMKVALSAPGAVMTRPYPVGNERILTAREYRERPITTSVQIFHVFHEHILEIVRYVPDVDNCYVIDSEGRKHFFRNAMAGLISGHTEEHIEEIWAIRRKHGK